MDKEKLKGIISKELNKKRAMIYGFGLRDEHGVNVVFVKSFRTRYNNRGVYAEIEYGEWEDMFPLCCVSVFDKKCDKCGKKALLALRSENTGKDIFLYCSKCADMQEATTVDF